MEYIGLQTQINRNNKRSLLLLAAFPALMLALTWLFFFIMNNVSEEPYPLDEVHYQFIQTAPIIAIGVIIWFLISWFSHSSMIQKATGAKPLERMENKRVYNLLENLCISKGMTMPKLFIIEDNSLNAFASGINEKTYAVTLSRGIIDKLDDQELQGVIAHELSHIRNRDVRLLIISIIFVGIFAFVAEIAFRSLLYGGGRRSKKGNNGGAIIVIAVLGIIGYLLSLFFRFAISRKREYLADAGAAEMTHNPTALASALKKISSDPWIESVERDDVAQLFIDHPKKKAKGNFFSGLFATHPPIEDRIRVLEQF